MKPTDFLSGIIHLFNDLIGAVVPGIILIAGLVSIEKIPTVISGSFEKIDISIQWFLIIVISYVLGHALLSLHSLLQPHIGKSLRVASMLLRLKKPDTRRYPQIISGTSNYKIFLKVISERVKSETSEASQLEFEFNNLRSIAMTVSNEAGEIARRFMFISLFCYGIAMSVLVLSVPYLIESFSIGRFVSLLLLFFIFYDRGMTFEYRALQVPFPIALSEILVPTQQEKDS